jgi:transcriptional regulator GlxA family with amidase domain
MKIGILLFDKFTALDVVGPYEVLSRLPDSQICFIGLEKKEYKDPYGLKLSADYAISEISTLDVLLIPGGFGIDSLLTNQSLINWIKSIDNTSKWTVSVCSGSLLLAQTGLLNGKKCTTHWRRKDQLRLYNVTIINERYVHDGKYMTSAGVSAGIDMALYLVSQMLGDQTAKLIQLSMEYDPKPPFDCGSPDKVPQDLMDKLKI